MTPAQPLGIVPRRHSGRWVAAAVVVLLLAAMAWVENVSVSDYLAVVQVHAVAAFDDLSHTGADA